MEYHDSKSDLPLDKLNFFDEFDDFGDFGDIDNNTYILKFSQYFSDLRTIKV